MLNIVSTILKIILQIVDQSLPKTVQLKRFPRFIFYPIAHSYIGVGILNPFILRAISLS